MNLLRTTYPAFCTGQRPPFDPDSLIRAEYPLAAHYTSAAALQERLQRIASRLHDGHTRIRASSKNPDCYPLRVWAGDELRLTAVKRGHEAALGKRIAAINDRPVAEVRPDVVLTLTWDDYLRGTDIFQQWIMEQR